MIVLKHHKCTTHKRYKPIENQIASAKKDRNLNFDEEYIFKTYIQPLGQIGKEKTPEEKEKSKIEVNQIYADIKQLLSNQPEFDTIEQAKTKITKFINK